MTTMEFTKFTTPAAPLHGESSLPPIAGMINVQQQTKTILDEDDGLFIGYGFVNSSFPYRLQDMYDRELVDTQVDSVVLENEHLRALFLPGYGGRLWSLFDKDAGKELTFANPVIRPGNLAIRNAWLSGGVEWNCGMVGHHPFTCSQVFTAKLQLDDGTPVLRMYEFERIRRAVYQMDFFLPDGSKVLYARMRIVNPNHETVPMYWWSNIAVPELPDGRVIMSTNDTYTNRGNMVTKTDVPISDGIDITYPVNNPHAIDFFWKIRPNKRKYVCQLNKQGYGLVQTSTQRLKGRKLFVWGQGPGGDHWQEFLSKEGDGRYAEIQAGLAHTQYECLPMPPKTAWEWLEAYGAMNADGSKTHSEWEGAKAEVETALNAIVTEDSMEDLLEKTHGMATRKADQILLSGSGWGALEVLRRQEQGEEPFCAHLDFGEIGTDQESWKFLLENGYFPDLCSGEVPASWMLQTEWTALLEKAVASTDEYNWYTWLQLGMIYFSENEIARSKDALDRSMKLKASCWSLYGLSNIARLEGKAEKAAMLALRAAAMKVDDASLAKEAMKLLTDGKMYAKAVEFAKKLPAEVAQIGRIKLYLAFAYLKTDNIPAAEELLYENEGISVADVREGENSVTELWFEIEEAKAVKDGRSFDRATAQPPAMLDFRMDAEKK